MKALKEFDESLWWEVARDFPHTTFFHTPAWSKAVVNAYESVSDATLAFELQGGGHAILPLQEKGKIKGLLRQLTSTFAGSYGDLITNGPITDAERHAIYKHAASNSVGRLKIIDNPFVPAAGKPGLDGTEDFTQVMPLENGYEALVKSYKPSCRNKVNKARRKGLTARAALDSSDIDAYYSLYQQNLERWSKAGQGYRKGLFDGLLLERQANALGCAKLWLVETEDKRLVGGTLVLYWNLHAVEWHAAFDGDFFRHGVRNYLVDSIIQDACRQGLSYYDFNPSGGHDGVVQFKESFRPKRQAIKRWRYQHPVLRLRRRAKQLAQGW